MMFDSIRDTFQSVQEGISASFRGLSVSDSHHKSQRERSVVNYNVGADLLHKYQTEWSQLHKVSEDNATLAQELDVVIGNLHESFEKQWVSVGQISSSLVMVPQLFNSVQQLMEQIGMLQSLFDDVEVALFRLEDMVEIQELQEKQLEHRFQFALYKEKRLAQLESIRGNLATEHAEKVVQHELRQQHLLRERQELFQQAFHQDVEEYKQTGTLAKIADGRRVVERGPSLEEVTLEPDDLAELDHFLNDSGSHNPYEKS